MLLNCHLNASSKPAATIPCRCRYHFCTIEIQLVFISNDIFYERNVALLLRLGEKEKKKRFRTPSRTPGPACVVERPQKERERFLRPSVDNASSSAVVRRVRLNPEVIRSPALSPCAPPPSRTASTRSSSTRPCGRCRRGTRRCRQWDQGLTDR